MKAHSMRLAGKILLGTILSLVLLAAATMAFGYPGLITDVGDGDTIHSGVVKIRLSRIDAPELDQPGGIEARDFLAGLVLGKVVEVLPVGLDIHGRQLAGLLVDGRSVQGAMVSAGQAWVYTAYCRRCQDLKALEGQARQARLGLWAVPNPVPPWEWRKHKKEVNP